MCIYIQQQFKKKYKNYLANLYTQMNLYNKPVNNIFASNNTNNTNINASQQRPNYFSGNNNANQNNIWTNQNNGNNTNTSNNNIFLNRSTNANYGYANNNNNNPPKIGTYRANGYIYEKPPANKLHKLWSDTNFPISIMAHQAYQNMSTVEMRIQDYYSIRTGNLENNHKTLLQEAADKGKFNRALLNNTRAMVPPTTLMNQTTTYNTNNPWSNTNNSTNRTYGNSNYGSNNNSNNPFDRGTNNTNSGNNSNIFSNTGGGYNSNPTNSNNIFATNNNNNLNTSRVLRSQTSYGNYNNNNSSTNNNIFSNNNNNIFANPNNNNNNMNSSTYGYNNNSSSNNNIFRTNNNSNNIFASNNNMNNNMNNNIFNNNNGGGYNNNNNSNSSNYFNNNNSSSNNIFANNNNNGMGGYNNNNNIFANRNSNNMFANNNNQQFMNNNQNNNNMFANGYGNNGGGSYMGGLGGNMGSNLPFMQPLVQFFPIPEKIYNQYIKGSGLGGVSDSTKSGNTSSYLQKQSKIERELNIRPSSPVYFEERKRRNKSPEYLNIHIIKENKRKNVQIFRDEDPEQQFSTFRKKLQQNNTNRQADQKIVVQVVAAITDKDNEKSEHEFQLRVLKNVSKNEFANLVKEYIIRQEIIETNCNLSVEVKDLNTRSSPYKAVIGIVDKLINVPAGYFATYASVNGTKVTDLTIGNQWGKIIWKGVTNVKGINFLDILKINENTIDVYENRELPEIGEELNKQCIVIFNTCILANRMRQKQGTLNKEKLMTSLKKGCESRNSEFLHYDELNDIWSLRIKHF